MDKHEYIYTTDKQVNKGYFNIHQGRKGGIYLGMNVTVTLLSKQQVEELRIDVYQLSDFDIDLYNSFYAKNMVKFDKAVTELMEGANELLKEAIATNNALLKFSDKKPHTGQRILIRSNGDNWHEVYYSDKHQFEDWLPFPSPVKFANALDLKKDGFIDLTKYDL